MGAVTGGLCGFVVAFLIGDNPAIGFIVGALIGSVIDPHTKKAEK